MSRHITRRFLSSSLIAAVVSACPVWAVPEATDKAEAIETVANTPYAATFMVNANAVYVRSGPADSYYPTIKLEKGTRVKAVGMKLDWLKVVPPEGSFCYISKVHVDRTGDGSVGRVNGDAVNVRAGSTMNAMKIVTLCQLSVGAEVKIVGEQDEYFKIAPPSGKAFYYINKQFVDPDPTATPEKQPGTGLATKDEQKPAVPQVPFDGKPEVEKPTVADATTQPADKPGVVVDKAPATQPSTIVKTTPTQPAEETASAESLFEKAEAEFNEANTKPVDQQPIAKLIGEYEPLVAGGKLTNTLHRIAETRLATLKVRAQAADELAKAKEVQDGLRKKQVALQGERKELEERLSTLGVAAYTAVGELQTSSLQLGSKTLYRLTDPANGRTVCYVRTDDPKFGSYLSKFVGMKGELANDPHLNLRVLTAAEITPVDPAKVNKTVSATVMPPSMTATDDATVAGHSERQ